MIQMLFPNNAVFQDDSAPIHTSGTVQSFVEEQSELQHLSWPAQPPDLNITEPLWSVLETSEEQIPTSNISKATWRSSSGRMV
jgi:hypothetical protein